MHNVAQINGNSKKHYLYIIKEPNKYTKILDVIYTPF